MTKPIFFDTDSISAFFWVNREDLLLTLYPGRIILPKEVYKELTNPRIPHIASRVKELYHSGKIKVRETLVGSDEYDLYYKLAHRPQQGERKIGRGEASALAMADAYKGIVASNNIKDILPYIRRYDLDHLTTGWILKEAYDKDLITEEEGNTIWAKMKDKKRQLPSETFTGFLIAGI